MLIIWLGLHIFCRALVRAGASYAGREIWLHHAHSLVRLAHFLRALVRAGTSYAGRNSCVVTFIPWLDAHGLLPCAGPGKCQLRR